MGEPRIDAAETVDQLAWWVNRSSRQAYEIGQLIEMLRACERHCSDGWIASKARELLAEHGVQPSDGGDAQ